MAPDIQALLSISPILVAAVLSGIVIVALQAVGASAGNIIAIQNVVAASATIGMLGREGTTLRKTIIPTLYYVTMVGLPGSCCI